ncbi:hypothetical protein [Clostridium oceanicum]|uniref:Uncharacterized protein n=1 Tax=Clostridium oceanicum TaxID=1543 RepID=A0ABN1J8J8_9CLOT
MNIFISLFFMMCIILFIYMCLKNRIILDLNKKCFNLYELKKATKQKLIEDGHNCEIIDNEFLMINGEKYILSKMIEKSYFPIEQVILVKSK